MSNIRRGTTLLKHVGDASDIGHEGPRLFGPGNVAIDMSPDHGVAGLCIEWLVRRGMEDKEIDALGKPVVRDLFQRVGRFITAASKGFLGDDRLP